MQESEQVQMLSDSKYSFMTKRKEKYMENNWKLQLTLFRLLQLDLKQIYFIPSDKAFYIAKPTKD